MTEICRKYGVSPATYQRWKSAYGGLEVSQMRRLRQLEDENRRLKQIVADLTLDNTMLKDITSKMVTPALGREMADHLTTTYKVSQRMRAE